MRYPSIRIVGESSVGSKVYFMESEQSKPIDLTSVIQSIELTHFQRQPPQLKLAIVMPAFELSVEATSSGPSPMIPPDE